MKNSLLSILIYFLTCSIFFSCFGTVDSKATSQETEANVIASGTCGDNVLWSLDSSGEMTISGSGAMIDYQSGTGYSSVNKSPWKDYIDQIRNVKVSHKVTSIGGGAFNKCINLKSIYLPDTINKIGSSAFANCTSLTTIILPDELQIVGIYAFYKSGLTEINIPKSAVSIGYSAFAANYLKKITVDPNNVNFQSIDGVLYSGKQLVQYPADKKDKVYRIPDGIESIRESAFSNAANLMYIVIPDTVTERGDFVFKSSGIMSVIIPNSLSYIPWDYFAGCNRLECVVLPNSIIQLDEAFDGCENLKVIHYVGSQEEWDNISKPDNYYEENFELHFVTQSSTDTLVNEKPNIYCEKCNLWFGEYSDYDKINNYAEYHINSITVSDTNGIILSSIPLGASSATVSITNLTSEDNALVCLAVYSAEGQYQGMVWDSVKDVPVGATAKVTLPVDNSSGKVANLKAFAIRSFSTLELLGNPISFMSNCLL